MTSNRVPPSPTSESADFPFPRALRGVLRNDPVHRKQRHWATFLNVSASAVSQWLSGRTIPRPDRLHLILEHAREVGNPQSDELHEVVGRPAQHVLPPSLQAGLGQVESLQEYALRGVRVEICRLVDRIDDEALGPLLLNARALVGGERRGNGLSRQPRMHRWDALAKRASQTQAELQASSVTVYLSDPCYAGDYVLAAESGLEYPEAITGPWMARVKELYAPQRGLDGDYVTDPAPREVSPSEVTGHSVPPLLPVGPHARSLYAPLLARERIRSYAREIRVDVAGRTCIVFANYRTRRQFGEETPGLRSALHKLAGFAEAHRDELLAELHGWARTSRKLVADLTARLEQPADDAGAVSQRAWSQHLWWLLQELRDRFGLASHHEPCIRLFVPSKRVHGSLVEVAHYDTPGRFEPLEVIHPDDGRSLVLWVSLRRRVLWIEDVPTSPFRCLCTDREADHRSLLVIPLFQSDRLLGVIQMGWAAPQPLDRGMLRPIAVAADRMMAKIESFRRQCLTSLWDQLTKGAPLGLADIVELARAHFGLRDCDLWSATAAAAPSSWSFRLLESTYGEQADHAPRESEGWSAYVVRHQVCVFVALRPASADPEGVEWIASERIWSRPRFLAPSRVNDAVHALHVGAELGVPITWQGGGGGVLWLKFARPDSESLDDAASYGFPPDPHMMTAVRLFARSISQIPQLQNRRATE